DPPCGASAHRLAVLPGLVGQVAIAELWVLPVGIEQRVSAVGLIEFSRGDRVLEPPVIRLASEIKYPPAPPRRGYRQQQARSRAGTTFSRQVRLRQVSGSAAQDLVLLLQQPNAAFGLAQLLGLRGGRARLDPGLDVGLADPLLQRHGMDTEVGGDLLERHTVFTGLGDANHVVAELLGIGPRAQQHPSRPPRQGKPDQMSPTRAPGPPRFGAAEQDGQRVSFTRDRDAEAAADDGIRRYRGTVTATARFNLVEVAMKDPWIEPRPDGSRALTALVSQRHDVGADIMHRVELGALGAEGATG